MFNSLRKAIFTGLVVLGAAAGAAGSAHAGGYGYGYGASYHGYYHKKVITYVVQEVAYTQPVTLYDHCGQPYVVEKTFYKTVQVPVVSYVKVAY